jgi:predicted MFS family arabinose efflux permease
LVGLGIFTLGTALAASFPGFWSFLLALLFINLGDNVFLPSMQAYISDRVSYEKRGAYIGTTELAWALSFILAIPLIGLLIQATWWYIPYAVLAGLGGVSMLVVLWRFPADHPKEIAIPQLYSGLGKVFREKNALLMLAAGMLMVVANGLVNVIFGVWMEDSFHLQIAALGLASMVIGFSELGGETFTTLLTDRLGKERAMMTGLLANCLTVASLPFLRFSLIGSLVWLSLFFMSFEFSITSSWLIVSEVLPKARATMIAVYIAGLSLALGIGNAMAPFFYNLGVVANGVAAGVFNLLAIWALSRIRISERSS